MFGFNNYNKTWFQDNIIDLTKDNLPDITDEELKIITKYEKDEDGELPDMTEEEKEIVEYYEQDWENNENLPVTDENPPISLVMVPVDVNTEILPPDEEEKPITTVEPPPEIEKEVPKKEKKKYRLNPKVAPIKSAKDLNQGIQLENDEKAQILSRKRHTKRGNLYESIQNDIKKMRNFETVNRASQKRKSIFTDTENDNINVYNCDIEDGKRLTKEEAFLLDKNEFTEDMLLTITGLEQLEIPNWVPEKIDKLFSIYNTMAAGSYPLVLWVLQAKYNVEEVTEGKFKKRFNSGLCVPRAEILAGYMAIKPKFIYVKPSTMVPVHAPWGKGLIMEVSIGEPGMDDEDAFTLNDNVLFYPLINIYGHVDFVFIYWWPGINISNYNYTYNKMLGTATKYANADINNDLNYVNTVYSAHLLYDSILIDDYIYDFYANWFKLPYTGDKTEALNANFIRRWKSIHSICMQMENKRNIVPKFWYGDLDEDPNDHTYETLHFNHFNSVKLYKGYNTPGYYEGKLISVVSFPLELVVNTTLKKLPYNKERFDFYLKTDIEHDYTYDISSVFPDTKSMYMHLYNATHHTAPEKLLFNRLRIIQRINGSTLTSVPELIQHVEDMYYYIAPEKAIDWTVFQASMNLAFNGVPLDSESLKNIYREVNAGPDPEEWLDYTIKRDSLMNKEEVKKAWAAIHGREHDVTYTALGAAGRYVPHSKNKNIVWNRYWFDYEPTLDDLERYQ